MQTDNRLRLSNGQYLGYARFGREGGAPAFYFHGLPGSRCEGALFHQACLEAGVELIAPDRPGFGWSDPVPGSRLRRWPRLVAELADHLGFDGFHLIGFSGGAPYALACACLLGARVRGTATCGGLGELRQSDLRADMAPQARLGFWLAEHSATWLSYSYGVVTHLAARRMPHQSIRIMARLNGEPDRSVLREPAVHALFAASLHEAFRQGPSGGVADMCAAVEPWPFDPSVLASLQLWHGRRDRIVPCLHTERLVRRVPAARATYVDGEGHFSLPVRRARAILDSLILG